MKKFCLERSLLVVSFRCNNRCKLCGVLSPYYENPLHFSAKELCQVIQSYFEVVTYVDKFTISGGEPLLHPELAKVMERLKQYRSQYGKVQIITNGKLLMNMELAETVKEIKEIEFLIDDYGINSKQCRMLEKQVRENGNSVVYRVYYGEQSHMGGWFDMGDFTKRNRTEEETQKVFRECPMSNKHFGLFIVGNEGHVCFRSWRAMDIGCVNREECEDEFIDFLSNESIECKREKIEAMKDKADAFGACYYCWGQGKNIPRVPAGEQLE